jgi:hypothetical protein
MREYNKSTMPTEHTEYTEYVYTHVRFISYNLYIYSNNINGFYLDIILAMDMPV